MKDKFNESWQKKWIEEIDARTPELADFVRNEPIAAVEAPARRTVAERIAELLSSSRARAIAGTLAMMIIVVCAVLIFRPSSDLTSAPTTVVAVQINPSALFTADADGVVCSVVAINDDADMVMILPEFEQRIIGKPLDEAVAAFADMCSSLGFVDYSGDAMRVTAIEGDTDLESVGDALSSYFKSHGIFVAIDLSQLSEADFCTEFNISDVQSTVADAVHAMISNCCEREAAQMELDELREEYERSVIAGDLNIYIKEELEAHIGELPEPWASIMMGLIEHLSEGESVDRDQLVVIYRQIFGGGGEDERIESILDVPNTLQEYIEKRKEYSEMRIEELKRKNSQSYNEQRESLGEGEYNDFINGIVERYGSLAEYFAQKHAS